MNELTPHNNLAQQHEERKQVQEQHYRILGKQIHVPGLTLFEYDTASKVLRRAEMVSPKEVVAIPTGHAPEKRHDRSEGLLNPEYWIRKHSEEKNKSIGRVLFKSGCVYFEALNDGSASRKVAKLIQRGEL